MTKEILRQDANNPMATYTVYMDDGVEYSVCKRQPLVKKLDKMSGAEQ